MMRTYLLKRIIISLIILWIAASLNFVIFQVLSPIRPEQVVLDVRMSPETRASLASLYGLADTRVAFLDVANMGEEGWNRVGNPPYLDASNDESYVFSNVENETTEFQFQGVDGTLLLGRNITIRLLCRQTGENETIEIWTWVASENQFFKSTTINPSKSYGYQTVNVYDEFYLGTLAQINNATFTLRHVNTGGETGEVYVDHVSLTFNYGVPRPIYVRYAQYIQAMFTWNFGYSFGTLQPVAEEMSWRLPTTMLLLGSALILTILIGIPLGILAASRRGSTLDATTIGAGLFTWGVPTFFIQLFFMLIFSYYFYVNLGFKLFPESGLYSTPPPADPLVFMADVAWHLAMPVITLVIASFGSWALYTRSLLLDALTQDYIVTARAKGLRERTVLYRHAFRSTLPPIVTMIALAVPGIIGGAVITEWIFTIRGIGQWYLQAMLAADYPVVQAVLFVYAVLMIFANLVADLLYGVLDPRIRVGVRR